MSAAANQGSNWAIQILFGRYRPWGNLTWVHLVILTCMLATVTYVYMMLLNRRLRNYKRSIQEIPRSIVPLRQNNMSRKMYGLMMHEMYRVGKIREAELKPEPANGGDPGWGKAMLSDGNIGDVHFNISIAKSYYDLEKTALSRRPGLWHKEKRTIRDYVTGLRKAFPGLRYDLCQEYINTYERAVFSSHKFTVQEYVRFMRVVSELVALINEKSLPLDERS